MKSKKGDIFAKMNKALDFARKKVSKNLSKNFDILPKTLEQIEN